MKDAHGPEPRALSRLLRIVGERRRRAHCPTPTKDAHRHEPEAIAAATSATASYGWPMEHYKCRCGAWHIARARSAQRIREQSTR